MGQPRKDKPDEWVDLQAVDERDIVQDDTGWKETNDTDWREVGDMIDHNAIRRAAEAVRAHERKHHPSVAVQEEGERIPDETLRSIIRQVEQEDCGFPYAVEYHNVKWSQFVVDIADYEGRMRKDLEDRRWGRK